MKYSLAYQGWSGLTAEGGSLGTIEIQHDGRRFQEDTESLIKIKYVYAQPRKPIKTEQKYYAVATRCKQFVKVVFTHSSGCKGVRFIQCPDKKDLQQVKEMFIQEYLMLKGLSDDTWTVKAALMEETDEVVFKDLEEA